MPPVLLEPAAAALDTAALLAGQNAILRLIADGVALTDILDHIAHTVERIAAPARCSILLQDPTGTRLLHGAAPSLPASYNAAINGIAISPAAGSCGTAAYRQEAVIVTDIESDPLWTEFRHLALPLDLRACWSEPIRARSGTVLGTFALYYAEPRAPGPADYRLLHDMAQVVRIALERHRVEEERSRAEAELRASEARHRALVEATAAIVWTTSASGIIETEQSGWTAFTGQDFDAVKGWGWLAAVHPDDRAHTLAAWRRAVASRTTYEVEHRLCRTDGEYRHMAARAVPVLNIAGELAEWIGIHTDVTEKKRAEARQRLLMREVDHRARNALAVVQAVLRLTQADDVATFIAAVDGRIEALARAHTLLARDKWTGADLHALIGEELAPYRGVRAERVCLSGPALRITADAVQPLGMVLHELATNAAKHGALSRPDGSVAVTWAVTEGGDLRISWRETGGPSARTPAREGFGSTLILTAVVDQLGGQSAFAWEPTGLHCVVTVAADRLVRTGAAEPGAAADRGTPAVRGTLAGQRVLVVEDDALLALAMTQTLRHLGCVPLGPAASVNEALTLVAGELDAAVLDINLRGQESWAVAEALTARGVPYLITTGYGDIPAARRGVPVLEKPFSPDRLAAALGALLDGTRGG